MKKENIFRRGEKKKNICVLHIFKEATELWIKNSKRKEKLRYQVIQKMYSKPSISLNVSLFLYSPKDCNRTRTLFKKYKAQ